MSFRFKNVRVRLTLWYTVALTFILLIYSGLFILLVFINLRNNLADQLEQDYELIENMIEVGPDHSIHFDSDDDPFMRERWIEIWSENGKLLYNSRPFSGGMLSNPASGQMKLSKFKFKTWVLENNMHLQSLTGKANIDGNVFIFRLFRPEGPILEEIHNYIMLLLLALPVALIISALGGYWLAGRLLSPIDRMTETAKQVSSTSLHERLPVKNPSDELGRLAITFNDLLERIQISFERLKQFTYDAAHELRTPLTAIRSIGEVALQGSQKPVTYREIIGSILEENNRLAHLVNSLLFLSRVDSDTFILNKEYADLEELTDQTIDIIRPLAEEKRQTLRYESTEPVTTLVDKTLVRQALLNLLDNAIKYAPENSTITVNLEQEEKMIHIRVADQGVPIPELARHKIFERFYRLDKSRSKELGGSGLGLSIAKWAIEIQGGKLSLSTENNTGNIFIIHLPISSKKIKNHEN